MHAFWGHYRAARTHHGITIDGVATRIDIPNEMSNTPNLNAITEQLTALANKVEQLTLKKT
jgi:hypothetical protein